MALPLPTFCQADTLPQSSISYTEELEQRLRDQDAIIAEQQETIAAFEKEPKPARLSPDALKDSERFILMSHINDLTIANNALEIELRQLIKQQQLILDTYLDIDPIIFDENNESCKPIRDAAKRRAITSKEFGSRIISLEDRTAQLEDDRNERNAQPKQKNRGAVLLALLAANNGKMLALDARHKLEISETAFSLLLRTLTNRIEVKSLHSDRRKNLIILK